MAMQKDWRYCQKCHAMFYDGFPDKGRCATGGGHEALGFNFALPHGLPETPTSQKDWRYCQKCHAMFYDGFPDKGRCVAGGGHEALGFNFVLPYAVRETLTAQRAWRYCQKCHAMFYDGFSDKGRCAAGGGHEAVGLNFVLPHDVPAVLEFDFNPIVFGGGVPVGGYAHLTIREDGSFTFSGHFHDSGGIGYKVSLVWAVKDAQNNVYTFATSGNVAGTFQPGSRDYDWHIDSRDVRLADNWANIAAGPLQKPRADANFDLLAAIKALVQDLGVVIQVIAIVA